MAIFLERQALVPPHLYINMSIFNEFYVKNSHLATESEQISVFIFVSK